MQNEIKPKSRYYLDRTNNERTMSQIKPTKELRNPDSYLAIAKRRKSRSKTQPKYEYNFLSGTHSLSMSPQILLDYRKSQLCKQIKQKELSCTCNCHNCCHYNNCHNFTERNSTSLRSQSSILNRKIKKNIEQPKSNKSSKKNLENKSVKTSQSFDKNKEIFKENGKKKVDYYSNNNTLKSKKTFKKPIDINNNNNENETNLKNSQMLYNNSNPNYKYNNNSFNDRYNFNSNNNFSLKNSNGDLNNIQNDININNVYNNTQPNNFDNNMNIYESNTFNKLSNSYNFNEPQFSKNKLFYRTQPITGNNTENNSNKYLTDDISDSFSKLPNENFKTCEYSNQSYKANTINTIKNYIYNKKSTRNRENDRYDIIFDNYERKIKKLLGKLPNDKNKKLMIRSMYLNINTPKQNKIIDSNLFRRSIGLKSNRY